jgi:hypothetical protein
METVFTYVRSTKGTHLYASQESDVNPISRSVYIQKAALPVPAPKRIKLTLEEVNE